MAACRLAIAPKTGRHFRVQVTPYPELSVPIQLSLAPGRRMRVSVRQPVRILPPSTSISTSLSVTDLITAGSRLLRQGLLLLAAPPPKNLRLPLPSLKAASPDTPYMANWPKEIAQFPSNPETAIAGEAAAKTGISANALRMGIAYPKDAMQDGSGQRPELQLGFLFSAVEGARK